MAVPVGERAGAGSGAARPGQRSTTACSRRESCSHQREESRSAAVPPYLTGYVAFYNGDYKTAIAELQKADQRDPLNLVLLAQAYEKPGDAAAAMDFYRKVLESNGHSPTNAFARPLAKKKLAALM